MHAFAQTVADVSAPLKDLAQVLATLFASIAASPIGLFALAAMVTASLVLAFVCGVWAIGERKRAAIQIERLSKAWRQSQATVHFRNALLQALPESVVVLPTRTRRMLEFQAGRDLLAHCLAGPDAARLATAMEQLMTRGRAFEFNARTIGLRHVVLRGRVVGDTAAVFLREEPEAASTPALPAPRALALPAPDKVRMKPALVSAPVVEMRSHAGTAVVGADGRLKRFDKPFAQHWSLAEGELNGQPHLRDLAALTRARSGRDAIWDIIASAAASPEPARHGAWGPQTGGNGRPVWLSFSRLSDGDTLVSFGNGSALAATA